MTTTITNMIANTILVDIHLSENNVGYSHVSDGDVSDSLVSDRHVSYCYVSDCYVRYRHVSETLVIVITGWLPSWLC